MSKKTVYIVTEGCYSDYTICKVFSKRPFAERYCVVHPDSEIEEYEMDSWDQESIMRKYYSAAVVIETGEMIDSCDGSAEGVPSDRVLYRGDGPYHYGNNRIGVSACSFVSREHALKMATDFRTKVLAERAEGMRDERYNLIEKAGVMTDE